MSDSIISVNANGAPSFVNSAGNTSVVVAVNANGIPSYIGGYEKFSKNVLYIDHYSNTAIYMRKS